MYELFASIYCDLYDLTKDLRRDQALEIHGCSTVEKYETDKKDIAVRRFQASDLYISFCNAFWDIRYSSMHSIEIIPFFVLIKSRKKTEKRIVLL